VYIRKLKTTRSQIRSLFSVLTVFNKQSKLPVECLGDSPVTKSNLDLLQGTLDLLILKTLALGPIHGYGISQRIQQISKDVLRVQVIHWSGR
jgi:hypothetical protein